MWCCETTTPTTFALEVDLNTVTMATSLWWQNRDKGPGLVQEGKGEAMKAGLGLGFGIRIPKEMVVGEGAVGVLCNDGDEET